MVTEVEGVNLGVLFFEVLHAGHLFF